MREKAWEKYKAETERPIGNWGDGYRLSKLPPIAKWERAHDRYYEVCAEIERRKKQMEEN